MVSDIRIIKLGLGFLFIAWGLIGWSLGPQMHPYGELGYQLHILQTILGLIILAHEMKMKR
jgi:hypothetical protein